MARVGTWRSLVAHTLGVRGVGGSNPLVPTTLHKYHAPFKGTRIKLDYSKNDDNKQTQSSIDTLDQ